MMSWHREATFEVVVEQGGKSSIDGVFKDEKAAMERAQYLLRLAKFPVVRVVKVNKAGREEVVFEKAAAGGGKNTTISPIASAEPCGDVLQVFSFDSRMTLLRLLRGYFDNELVIPAEQLHRYYPLRYFEREALLFNPALSRLAALQAPGLGIKPADRHSQLERMFNTLKELAQASGSLAPFDATLARGGVTGLLAAAAGQAPEERDRILTHAVGAFLEPHRDWRAKTAAILRLQEEGNGEATRLVDEFLAETIDGREPVRALIGYAPDLASALQALLSTVHGDLDDRLPHTDELIALSGAVGGGLTRVREALLRRVQGGLEGRTPLTRSGPAAEAAALHALLDRMAGFDGYMGGPAMAEALTRRAKVALGSSGLDLSFEETVQRLVGRLRGPGARIGYLLDLATSDFGRRKASLLIQQVAKEFDHVQSAAELAAPGVAVQDLKSGLGLRLRAAGIPRVLADGLIAKIGTTAAAASVPTDAGRAQAAEAETVDLAAARARGPQLALSYRDKRHLLQGEGVELVIGRSADCPVLLEVASASRRHAVLSVRDGTFVLTDTSRNGTWVALPAAAPRKLANGESLVLPAQGEILIGTPERGDSVARLIWEIIPRPA